MENFLTAQVTNVLKEEESIAETVEKNGEGSLRTVKSVKYKVLMLLAIAMLFCIQSFREIVSSEYLMQNIFYLANNYVNSSKANGCECACDQIKVDVYITDFIFYTPLARRIK